ncbi:MAG: MBL fold metallo-hydrolase [Schleiferiaceae bacterium]|jgi:phosphoribosyl 1,2-cyclic phosphodiesterase|nr:MBL fold metallo-hydrolase [Schleiferiaceae bacterium]
MKVEVWGCRGSLPSPGPEKNKYGGNTSCVEISEGDTTIILDGGSGIQRLGEKIGFEHKEVHILLTHLHIDHTMGLGFFLPLYSPKVTVHLYGPAGSTQTLTERLRRYFSPPLFPVRLSELPNHPIIHEVHKSEFNIGSLSISTQYVCHPSATVGYRISNGEKVFCYIPDHELQVGACNFPNEPEWTSGYNLALNADLLFHDAQYQNAECCDRIGWGHSSFKEAMQFAEMCNVKKLAFFHHDPHRTDDQLESILGELKGTENTNVETEMCAEGSVYQL